MNMNILYMAAGALLIYALFKAFGGKRMSANQIAEKIRAGARIIDVRTPGEYSQGAYPKARNIPLDSLPSRLGELGPKDATLVVYCASGARSAQAAAFLKRSGYADVVNAGGLFQMPRV